MSKITIIAWVIAAACLVAAAVSVIGQPLHWKRTLAVAVVLGVAAAITAVRQTQRERTTV